MKLCAPKYYKKFKCIADKCEHNCCDVWEIDVDESALKKYTVTGSIRHKDKQLLSASRAYEPECSVNQFDHYSYPLGKSFLQTVNIITNSRNVVSFPCYVDYCTAPTVAPCAGLSFALRRPSQVCWLCDQ